MTKPAAPLSGSVLVTIALVLVTMLGMVLVHREGGGSGTGSSAGGSSGSGPVVAAGPTTTESGSDPNVVPNADAPTAGSLTTPGATVPPRSLIKRPDSAEISVYAGGARIPYRNWTDLVAGYGADPSILTVSDAFYDSLPTTPAPGTLIKEAGEPAIAETTGSARVTFASWADLVAKYGPAPKFVTVPSDFFERLPQE